MSEPSQILPKKDLLTLTTEVAAAYLAKNTVAVNQVPELIRAIHASLGSLSGTISITSQPAKPAVQKPAVPVKKSIGKDYIICLEDGKKLKMLKRYLRSTYNMSPEQYRAKWNLPTDYPMVAPNYAEQRSQFAKKIGLGKGATGRPTKKKVA